MIAFALLLFVLHVDDNVIIFLVITGCFNFLFIFSERSDSCCSDLGAMGGKLVSRNIWIPWYSHSDFRCFTPVIRGLCSHAASGMAFEESLRDPWYVFFC